MTRALRTLCWNWRQSCIYIQLLFGITACHRAQDASVESHPKVKTAYATNTPIRSATPRLTNDSPFSPSFAQLEVANGKFKPENLGDSILCSSCHADVATQWESSAHRNSSLSNRFYAHAVSITRSDRGNKTSRWCAGCHDPALLLTESKKELPIDRDDVAKHPQASDGIGCLVCHSTVEGSRVGGGGYRLRWQSFVSPDVKNVDSITEHKKAMKPAALGEAEFCASCHKVSLHADVNGKRWLRGQNDFDPWEQGPYALGGAHTAGEIYAPEVEPKKCHDCHMPYEHSTNDASAKKHSLDGALTIRSHRFLAANTAVPTIVGNHEAVDLQKKMLAGAVRVDVIAVRHETVPSRTQLIEQASIVRGETLSFDVVVENTRTGHRFPGGTADSNQVWLNFEVRDASQRWVMQSGHMDSNGNVDSEAHPFGVLQLDSHGQPATMRDAHRFVAAGWDTTIAPFDSRVIRYAVTIPEKVQFPLHIKAQVLFRKFTPEYTKASCATQAASVPPLSKCPELPVVEVSRHELTLGEDVRELISFPTSQPIAWKRKLAYARGLLRALQEEVGDAEFVIHDLIQNIPNRAEGLIELARLRIRQGRTADALIQLDRAALLDPNTPVIPFLRGLAHYEVYRLGDAVEPLQNAVSLAPKNTHTLELLAEALELRNEYSIALDVLTHGLKVDPESAQLRHLEALAYDALNMPNEAQHARQAYLHYRRDDDTPKLRSLCKARIPNCAREANPLHIHELKTTF